MSATVLSPHHSNAAMSPPAHRSLPSTSASTNNLAVMPTPSPSSSSSSSAGAAFASSLVNRPSLIEYRDFRFLIMDAPTESNLAAYTEMLVKRNVVAVVRACEPSYHTDMLSKADIQVVEAAFADGDPPPAHIIDLWLSLVHRVFAINSSSSSSSSSTTSTSAPPQTHNANVPTADANHHSPNAAAANKPVIAVHCVAGLGRAPVLVAVALMEAGMPPLDVIDFIRKRRRGAFNSKQLKYIQSYKPRKDYTKDKCIIC